MTLSPDQHFLMETAMCLWEHVLGLLERKDPDMTTLVEGVGYGQLRMDVLDLAPELVADWPAGGWDKGCFDWDFVPDWFANNVRVSPDEGLVLSETRTIP